MVYCERVSQSHLPIFPEENMKVSTLLSVAFFIVILFANVANAQLAAPTVAAPAIPVTCLAPQETVELKDHTRVLIANGGFIKLPFYKDGVSYNVVKLKGAEYLVGSYREKFPTRYLQILGLVQNVEKKNALVRSKDTVSVSFIPINASCAAERQSVINAFVAQYAIRAEAYYW